MLEFNDRELSSVEELVGKDLKRKIVHEHHLDKSKNAFLNTIQTGAGEEEEHQDDEADHHGGN